MEHRMPTDDEIAGVVAEVRRAVYDRGRSSMGSVIKLAASSPDVAETADRLLTVTLENLQNVLERVLLRTFSHITHEQVMLAHRALMQSRAPKQPGE